MGWEIDATGLYDVLRRIADEYDAPPLYITENGAAFVDELTADGQVHDPDRVAYLDAHVRAAKQAIDDGVDLRGYFVWTLIDNFEWSFGFDRRFGVVHVDFTTQRRTIKDSGRWLASVAASNGIT
jgi:beta-glucosidase